VEAGFLYSACQGAVSEATGVTNRRDFRPGNQLYTL